MGVYLKNYHNKRFIIMISRLFWMFLSVAFPWLVLLIHDNPGGMLVAMAMQASIIGWIPATVWAMRVVDEARLETARTRAEKKARPPTNDAS
jgi:hypothetical protein